ncbi:MAG: hypothetical protein MZV70_45640 [Desulfobacterales bacterium]|nr:hypothetical protein [Desulfobacterales bacterium]
MMTKKMKGSGTEHIDEAHHERQSTQPRDEAVRRWRRSDHADSRCDQQSRATPNVSDMRPPVQRPRQHVAAQRRRCRADCRFPTTSAAARSCRNHQAVGIDARQDDRSEKQARNSTGQHDERQSSRRDFGKTATTGFATHDVDTCLYREPARARLRYQP